MTMNLTDIIPNAIRMNAAIIHSSSKSLDKACSQPRLSDAQITEIAQFMRIFPTEQSLIEYFAPGKWAAALANRPKCLLYNMVTLNVIRNYYGESVALQMVKNNLVGLYTVAKPHEFVNEKAVNLAASLFLGGFGNELPVFGALYYFASYLTRHRSSYTAFDLQDVLRQCDQKFMPQWRNAIHRTEKSRDTNAGTKETGRAALITYLRNDYVAKGIDIRTSALYKLGLVKEADIATAESMEPLPL